MLGRFVKVRVTRPIGFFDGNSKTQYRLNYGTVESGLEPHSPVKGAATACCHTISCYAFKIFICSKYIYFH